MTFISTDYAIFLFCVFLIYWLTPWRKGRLIILLAASLIFYASLQIQYIPLLLLCIFFNFGLALSIGEPLEDWQIANSSFNRRRLILLWIGITINLLLLLGFKYIPFLLNIIGGIFNNNQIQDAAVWVSSYIVPPLGLSFFCFEIIAYLIDVYRGAPPTNSLL
ncbi:membrane-bound O-acyltransferase family protein, partial [Arthrospira sp. O9.13F]